MIDVTIILDLNNLEYTVIEEDRKILFNGYVIEYSQYGLWSVDRHNLGINPDTVLDYIGVI